MSGASNFMLLALSGAARNYAFLSWCGSVLKTLHRLTFLLPEIRLPTVSDGKKSRIPMAPLRLHIWLGLLTGCGKPGMEPREPFGLLS